MTDLAGLPSALLGGLGPAVAAGGHPAQEVGAVGQAAQGLLDGVGGPGHAGGAPGPAGSMHHVVEPGETLGTIASSHGVSVGSMMSANPQVLHPDMIEAGTHLAVPSAPSRASAGAEASTGPPAAPGRGEAHTPATFEPGAAPGRAAPGSGSQTSLPEAPESGRLANLHASPAAAGGSVQAPEKANSAEAVGGADVPGEHVGASGLLFAALARGGVDWRLALQPGAGLLASTGASLQGASASGSDLGFGVLLQALAADPLAAAALGRLLGDGKAAVMAVLAARLAIGTPPETALAAGRAGVEAPPGNLAPPPGIDLAARAGVHPEPRPLGVTAGRTAGETPQDGWIRRCAPAAVQAKARWGVPAGFTIAHGALTSDWGRLAPGNDFFGLAPVRAPGASRALVALAGPLATTFDDLDDAAAAFGGRLRGDARYAAAFRTQDAAAFAARVAADGLVSDPLYAPALQAVIAAHGLTRFD